MQNKTKPQNKIKKATPTHHGDRRVSNDLIDTRRLEVVQWLIF